MADLRRLHPLRLCAAMAVMLCPAVALGGPAVDTKELRASLRALTSETSQNLEQAADVPTLFQTLGLGPAPEEALAAPASQSAAPKPALLPAAPKPAVLPAAPAPVAAARPSATSILTPGAAPAGVPSQGISGAGGLFSLHRAQKAAPAAVPTAPVQQPLITPLEAPVHTPEPMPMPDIVRAAAADNGLFSRQTAQQATPQPDAVTVAPQGSAVIGGAGGLFSLHSARKDSGQETLLPALGQAKPRPHVLEASAANFRVMLATLSQTYTAQNNQTLINAQGTRGPTALSIRSGTVTLGDLKRLSMVHGMAPQEDGTLTAPVLLWADAKLVLKPGERLALSRAHGAFVLSMGTLDVTGATIEGVGEENPHEPTFAPFVTVVAGGALKMQGATLRGLGFGRTQKFSGLTVAGNPLMPQDTRITIRETLFDSLQSVVIAGVPRAEIAGNTFQNISSAGLSLTGAPHALVHENLFRGATRTNSIRVEVGSDHADIRQNLFLNGSRVAVLINRGSRHVAVRDNVIWKRDGAGIKFLGAHCGRAEGNILLDNAQKGIEVRKSDGVVVQDNLLAGNQSAGVWVSAQAASARTVVRDNVFEANGAGLSSATGAEIWVARNNFKRQLPKLLDGDIARLTNAFVRDLAGAQTLRINRGQSQTHDALISLCGDNT